MKYNRSRRIDLIVNTLIFVFESMESYLRETKLGAVHRAATEANFTELVAAIELYQEHIANALTDEEFATCQGQSIREEFGDD